MFHVSAINLEEEVIKLLAVYDYVVIPPVSCEQDFSLYLTVCSCCYCCWYAGWCWWCCGCVQKMLMRRCRVHFCGNLSSTWCHTCCSLPARTRTLHFHRRSSTTGNSSPVWLICLFIYFFRTDSTDSPDCLPRFLSISIFCSLVFVFSTFLVFSSMW